MLTPTTDSSKGLLCPNCAAPVYVPEGLRVTHCQNCDYNLYVQGEDRGVRKWQVHAEVTREHVEKELKRFYRGIDKARDLKRQAVVKEIFLAYLPYWRVRAVVAGWRFGTVRVKRNKSTYHKPVEREVYEEMHWNDAATDVSEFGVHQVQVHHKQLEPYDSQRLHAEAMVFEPTESYTSAMQEAEAYFEEQGQKGKLDSTSYEAYHFLRKQLSIVYYPLWITRYAYQNRNYTVVFDGVDGKMLYGKAPGNVFYRAAVLTLAMAFGHLILVNGSALILGGFSGSDDGPPFLFLLFPVGIAWLIMQFGYRRFRYGEEVEKRKFGSQKAFRNRRRARSGDSLVPWNINIGGMRIDQSTINDISGRLEMLGDMDEADLKKYFDTLTK
ncbi:MAG: hypothetical protein AAF633_06240 [Chloroflexota bacterium]